MNFRHGEILTRIRRNGKVRVEPLARDLGVTVQTIRRDLAELDKAGLVARVHGGAVLRSGTSNIGYEDRRALNAEAKARIANSLAARIPNGASVFLDIGTTIEAVAEALSRHEGLLVVTNSMNAAAAMSRNPDAEVVLTGGILRRTDGGLVGEVTADFVRQFRVDTAVIAASAIDPTGDALDFDFREVRVAQAMIAQSRRAVLVADHSKYDRVAPVRIAALDAFSMFVTDKAPPASIAEAAQRGNTEILTT